jgi:hypothetical protein
MQRQPPADARGRRVWTVERAVVLQALRDDRDAYWSRTALAREIADCEPELVELALARLRTDGVLSSVATRVCASPATRRLDELELIAL